MFEELRIAIGLEAACVIAGIDIGLFYVCTI